MEKINTTTASSHKFAEGQCLLCYYHNMIYEAKCLKLCMVDGVQKYLVHYKGWNNRWDEWVNEDKLLVINKVNLDHMDTVNKEQLKIYKEKRSKTKNKKKTDVTPKKGRKRKLLEMSSELDTEEPIPSTSSNSTIPKKKKDQPPNISKTSTSKELKPPSASNQNFLLNCKLSRSFSIVVERLTDEQINEITKKKTNTKTHKIIAEKCDSIEITHPIEKCDKSSVVTNTNDTNYINTIKSIDLHKETSEFAGTSKVTRLTNTEISDDVNKRLNTMSIEIDNKFQVLMKQRTEHLCEADLKHLLEVMMLHCDSCGNRGIERISIIGLLERNILTNIKRHEILNNSNSNSLNFSIAQNECIESKPLTTENKNTTEFGMIENVETIKGKMPETETIQVDESLENFPEDTAQNKNLKPKEIMTKIKNTLGVSVIENLETSKSNFSEIEPVQINELSECPEDISTLNTEPKDVTKSNHFFDKDWNTFEKIHNNKTVEFLTGSMNFSETDLNKKFKITSLENSSEIGLAILNQLYKDASETNSTSTTENVDSNICMESLDIPETKQNKILKTRRLVPGSINSSKNDMSYKQFQTAREVNSSEVKATDRNKPSEGIINVFSISDAENTAVTSNNVDTIDLTIPEIEQNEGLDIRGVINSPEVDMNKKNETSKALPFVPETIKTNKMSKSFIGVISSSNIVTTKKKALFRNRPSTENINFSAAKLRKKVSTCKVTNTKALEVINSKEGSSKEASSKKASSKEASSKEASSIVTSSSNCSTADVNNLAEQFKMNLEDQVITRTVVENDKMLHPCGPPSIEIPCDLKKEVCFDWLLNNKCNRTLQGLAKITVADALHGYSQSQKTYEAKIRAKNFALFILSYFNLEVNSELLYQNEHDQGLKRKLKSEFDLTFFVRKRKIPYFDVMDQRKKIYCFAYGPIYLLRLLFVGMPSYLMSEEYGMTKSKFSIILYYFQDLLNYLNTNRERYFPIQENYDV